jgi:YesN/AraC family two-component response regulator
VKEEDGVYTVSVQVEPSNVFQTLQQSSTEVSNEKIKQGLDGNDPEVFATLVTRYAIEGGLNEETAFSLSDVYIRKMEQCTDVDALMKLNEQMAIEFTLRVAEAKKTPKNYYSPAISRVIDYIYHGKNKTLTLNQLASLVNLTPKYLSALFHKETGQTLTVFIHKVLIEKAKNLLAHSDYSLGEISTYLNFSSQSYFISIFKRYTGITPGQYRKLHRQISW